MYSFGNIGTKLHQLYKWLNRRQAYSRGFPLLANIVQYLNSRIWGNRAGRILIGLLWHVDKDVVDNEIEWRSVYSHHQMPQKVNSLWPSDAIRRQCDKSTLAQVMACCEAITWTNVDLSSVLWHSSVGIIMKKIWRYQLIKQDWKFHF